MDGILLINKPKDFTSHDVINVLRGILKTRKLGHTGTLDPDATGVLVVGVNKGTKIMKYLNNDEKIYQATVCIGIATDTLDKTGNLVAQKHVHNLEGVDEVLASFMGEYTQTPPMYSAIKYQGKRLYEYARKGIVIEDIPSRDIVIFDIERNSDIIYKDNCAYFSYTVHSAKGLYVRTLSYDIGKRLGYPAHNYELNRLAAGQFRIEQSYTLEEVKAGNYTIIPLSEALSELQTVYLNKEMIPFIKNGMELERKYFEQPVLSKIIDETGNLIAIYEPHPVHPTMKAVNIYHNEVD